AGIDRGASREQGHRLGGAAVILERAKFRVDGAGRGADMVATLAVGQAGLSGAVADEVVRAGERTGERAGSFGEEVAVVGGGVAGDDGVVEGGRGDVVDAAARGGGIAADGGIGDGERGAAVVVDA